MQRSAELRRFSPLSPPTGKTAQNKCLHFNSINLFHRFPHHLLGKTSHNTQVIPQCALFVFEINHVPRSTVGVYAKTV